MSSRRRTLSGPRRTILIHFAKGSMYSAFLVATPQGDLFAAAPKQAKPLSVADRPYFQEVLKSRGFVVGEHQIGRISGIPTIAGAYPALNHKGQVQAVVLAGISLEWLNQYIRRIKLPEESRLLVVDRNGAVLVHYPDPGHYVGRDIKDEPLARVLLQQKEGLVEAPGLHGIPKI